MIDRLRQSHHSGRCRPMIMKIEEMLNDGVRDNLPINLFITSPAFTIRSETTLQEAVKISINKIPPSPRC